MDEALDCCFAFMIDTGNTWARLPYERKIQFQKIIFPENLSFSGKTFGTTKLTSIYRLNNQYSGKKSHLVAPGRIELPFAP